MNAPAAEARKYPVHVGTITHVFGTAVVTATEILTIGGASPPADFVLEALDRPGGKVVAEFNATDSVNLTDDDRKFFRVVPRGGGRA